MLLYVGLKIRVKNENILCGSLLEEYKKCGYLFISEMFENGTLFLSDSPKGGINISADKSLVEPIYDDKILNVLREKKRIRTRLEIEIDDIENFINDRCRNIECWINSFIGKIKIKGDIYVRKSYENYGCKNR